jgi:hypothetical protein
MDGRSSNGPQAPASSEPLNDKLLASLEDYANRLSRDNAEYIELRWNYYIKAAAAVSGAGLILLGMISLRRYATFDVGWEFFSSVVLAFAAFLVILTAQFQRRQSRLIAQVRSATYLCKRLTARGSEMLEQSRLSNQEKFVLEIKLFEADRAVNEAETTFKSSDLSSQKGSVEWTRYIVRLAPLAVAAVIALIVMSLLGEALLKPPIK